MIGPEWNHGKDDERRNQRNDRRQREDPGIRPCGKNVFLEHQLDAVGDRLKNPVRTDPHGPKPDLNERRNFAFRQRHQRNHTGQRAEDNPDLDQRDEDVIDCKIHIRQSELLPVDLPSTISSVPITATTSATMCPITIFRSDCRFTNDGGRTRARYAIVLPSLTM